MFMKGPTQRSTERCTKHRRAEFRNQDDRGVHFKETSGKWEFALYFEGEEELVELATTLIGKLPMKFDPKKSDSWARLRKFVRAFDSVSQEVEDV